MDWIRKFCLSFPDATENMQWGEDLCFKVCGKIFAVVDLSKGKLAPISFKCAPEKFQELVEIEGIAPAPYVGRYQWVLLERAGILTSGELEERFVRLTTWDHIMLSIHRESRLGLFFHRTGSVTPHGLHNVIGATRDRAMFHGNIVIAAD